MQVADEAGPVVVVRRQMAVPRERVFAAWLDPESMAEWMRPKSSIRSKVTADPKVGGAFKIIMEGSANTPIEHRGEYLVIDPPSLLSFTWISANTDRLPTVVTIEFNEQGTGTELILTHRQLPARTAEGHRQGWTEIVRLLEEVLTVPG